MDSQGINISHPGSASSSSLGPIFIATEPFLDLLKLRIHVSFFPYSTFFLGLDTFWNTGHPSQGHFCTRALCAGTQACCQPLLWIHQASVLDSDGSLVSK